MRLTSSVKELEAILQKLIKSEPGLILVNNNDDKHLDDVDGDADNFWRSSGLGATTKRTKLFFHKN